VIEFSPVVGPPRPDQYRPVCGFAIDPQSPACDAPAVAHLVVCRDTGIAPRPADLAKLSACATHAPIARLAGNLVMEHAHRGVCDLPGTQWDFQRNRCVLDDSGRSRADQAAMAVPA